MRETPLHDVHRRLGAKLVEFGGWHMPVQYGPILAEVRLVREHVGLFDLSHMGRLRITGPDAVAFVDRVATCFCAKIPVGAIRYGLLCRSDGNPIDDLLVYRGEHEVFLVVNASNTDRDLAWLHEHAAGFAVDLEDHFDVVLLQPTESRALFTGFAGLAFIMFEELDGVGELEPEIDGPE
ncbi:MAG: glycine cleavage system aminomethyltransferase GcvT, partial [Planctomycetota bacterium]